MGRPLAQSFGQGMGCEVVVDKGGVVGRLACLSGQGGRYEMVVGVAKVVGLLARSFGQGWGRKVLG